MSFCAFSESQVFLNDFYSIGCFPLLGNDAALSTDLVDEFMVRALSIWAGMQTLADAGIEQGAKLGRPLVLRHFQWLVLGRRVGTPRNNQFDK